MATRRKYYERCEMVATAAIQDHNLNERKVRVTFTEEDIHRLAGEIQQTIEDFIERHERPAKPKNESTPEIRTCLRLLRQAVRRDGEAGTVAAVVACIRTLHEMAGLSYREAARVVHCENRLLLATVMDRIGLHPASDVELRAVQEVFNAHR